MSEHTPTPWYQERPEDELLHIVGREFAPPLSGLEITPRVAGELPRLCVWADSPVGPGSDCGAYKEIALVHEQADAEFIARACNSFDEMLAAVEETRDELKRVHGQLSEGRGIDMWGLSGLPMLIGQLQAAIAKARIRG